MRVILDSVNSSSNSSKIMKKYQSGMENCLKYFSQECHNHYVKFGHKKKILSKPTQVE